MILGKFLPPHLGHQFLVDFGRHYVSELLVLVCTLAREPIDGRLRFQWMREMFAAHANVRLVHVTDDLPQEPAEHPQFWEIWRDLVRAHQPRTDFVFASEAYGFKLAEALGARFIPVDPARQIVRVSGSSIRAAPLANYQFLPPPVRPHFVRRICLFGPESTGKSVLAARLAAHFRTAYVAEHARPLLDHRNGAVEEADIPFIARGQVAAEEAMARQANRLLFCDTDPLLTTVWSDVLYGRCGDDVARLAAARTYDLYLLLDVDCEWVDDGQRFLSYRREEFFDRCRATLERLGRPYVAIGGANWDERFDHAVAAIDDAMSRWP
jgi:HTH-type transcriptional regulator, transcriptional repressor of NAD biosynthesis genes